MAKTTHQKPWERNAIRLVLLAFILVASIIFFSIRDEPLWIVIASVVAIVILFSRIIFKEKFAKDNEFAFTLLIELVAVILGIYLGINANDLATEKGERKQLLKIVRTTKTDLTDCINKLTVELEKSDGNYFKNDAFFLKIRGSGLRHVFETPVMYEYLINNPSTIKFFPPEVVRRMISMNTFDKQIVQHLNACNYPTLQTYKYDLTTIRGQLCFDLEVLDLQIDYLTDDISSEEELLDRLKRYQPIRFVELYTPIDWSTP